MKLWTYLLIPFIFLGGCSPQSNVDMKKTLRLNFLSEPISLDPRYGYEIPANYLVKMLYEGLMRMDPDGTLRHAAAQSVTVSEDQKTYHFKIREGVWSNGAPITAYDFEYAWKSIIDPQLPTQGAIDFYPIKNVEAIVRGDLPLNMAGIQAIDSQTLRVDLEYPAPYFLELIASSAYAPVYSPASKENPTKHMETVFNGPFLVKERRPHHKILLVKNPTYWNAEEVFLEKINIDIVEDVATQLALFEKGEIDWLGKPFAKLPLDAVPSLIEKQLTHFPERAVYWYFLNTERFPFNQQKFREAFSLAVDRKAITSHILKEGEEAATSITRGWSFCNDNEPEKAKKLFQEGLQEAGLTEKTFPEITLSYCGIETNHRIASAVQQQWQNVLGIRIKLDPQEWTSYYDNLTSGNYLIGGMSWHSRIRDPIYNLQLFKYAKDRQNISSWEHPDFQKLIDAALNEPDQETRLHLLKDAEALLMHEMPVIPIYFLTLSYVKNSALKEIYISEINEIDFTWARKEY
jgi:oligopeptide transport system substrate-binding protein